MVKVTLNTRHVSLFLVVLAVGFAIAYGGTEPTKVGHSGGEVDVTYKGSTESIEYAIGDLETNTPEREVYAIYDATATETYSCIDLNLQDLCGDEDGCIIRHVQQHETNNPENLLIGTKYIFMETPDMLGDDSVTNGRAINDGGGGWNWKTGDTVTEKVFEYDSNKLFMFDWRHPNCENDLGGTPEGQTHSDPYVFTFAAHRDYYTKILIYDF